MPETIMVKAITAGLLVLAMGIAGGCWQGKTPPKHANVTATDLEALQRHFQEMRGRSEHSAAEIEVQHILIGIQMPQLSKVTRSIAEAEELAAQLFARALKGEDFDNLVRKYTDDSPPGKYTMINKGSGPPPPGKSFRSGMVPAFGNVGWRLKVGEIGVSRYDQTDSPFGFHIIKRLK